MKLITAGGSLSCPASTSATNEQADTLRAELGLPEVENKTLQFNHDRLREIQGQGLCVIAFLKGSRRPYCLKKSNTSMQHCETGNSYIYSSYLNHG